MAGVNDSMVREFFEMRGFLVRQSRKHVSPTVQDEEPFDLLVMNPRLTTSARGLNLPFELGAGDVSQVRRAIVVVKGWHSDRFSPGVLESSPEIFRFLEPAACRQAAKALGGEEGLVRLLVTPRLPEAEGLRLQSVQLLKDRGVTAVLSFQTILADLIEHVEINRNYLKSDLLQTIRILKNYDFFREPQLELFQTPRQRRRREVDRGAAEEVSSS